MSEQKFPIAPLLVFGLLLSGVWVVASERDKASKSDEYYRDFGKTRLSRKRAKAET